MIENSLKGIVSFNLQTEILINGLSGFAEFELEKVSSTARISTTSMKAKNSNTREPWSVAQKFCCKYERLWLHGFFRDMTRFKVQYSHEGQDIMFMSLHIVSCLHTTLSFRTHSDESSAMCVTSLWDWDWDSFHHRLRLSIVNQKK